MQILIVDDDEVDRKLVRRALGTASPDWQILEAADADKAKSRLAEANIDCLLLDYHLPDIDGIAFAQTLLNNGHADSFPIVMLTGEGNEKVAVEAMKCGIQDYLPKSEINASSLVRVINSAVEKSSLQRKIHEMNRVYEQMALYDSLTELGNRNLFNDQISHSIATARRNNLPFALFMMDLNKFKAINDNHGHEAGDMVLRETARRLRELSRDADSFFRLGGDEFAALVNSGATEQGVGILAHRIARAFDAPIEYQSTCFEPGVSIGVALYPEHGENADELLRNADAAMYRAKNGGLGYAIWGEDD